jgi:hypothetical protein
MTMKAMIGDGQFRAGQTTKKTIIFIVLASAFILLVPLVAMQFTNEVAWSPGDFAVAGALLAGTGLMYVAATSRLRNIRHRVVVGVALALALCLVWIELAVGIIGA